MPALNKVAQIASKSLPQILSPKAHAVADYCMIGVFLGLGARGWKRNKRMSLAALLCGGAQLAVSLLTDYPGGIRKVIPFRVHREFDLGLAALSATIPAAFSFEDDPAKKFFLVQGALITASNQLTRIPERGRRSDEYSRRRAKAA